MSETGKAGMGKLPVLGGGRILCFLSYQLLAFPGSAGQSLCSEAEPAWLRNFPFGRIASRVFLTLTRRAGDV